MKKVFVYRNLHKKCYSVKDWKTKKVIAHVDNIFLKDAVFKVSEAGRQRVLREKRKNVHAGVLGYWCEENSKIEGLDIYYNPYKHESFIVKSTEKPIKEAKVVFLHERGVLAQEVFDI